MSPIGNFSCTYIGTSEDGQTQGYYLCSFRHNGFKKLAVVHDEPGYVAVIHVENAIKGQLDDRNVGGELETTLRALIRKEEEAADAIVSRNKAARNADRIDGYDRDDLGESPDC